MYSHRYSSKNATVQVSVQKEFDTYTDNNKLAHQVICIRVHMFVVGV